MSMKSRGFCLFIVCAMLWSCAAKTLRPGADEEPRITTTAISPSKPSALRNAISPAENAHPGQSGVKLVMHGEEALKILIGMIQSAEHTVDLQYYLIEDDDADRLLL